MEVGIYIKCYFKGNPRGPGKAAAVVEYINGAGKSYIRDRQIQIANDTKNALLLKACIAAVRILLKSCRITIFVDCDYVKNTYKKGWLETWKRDGWKKANGDPPANVEEWKQFYMLTRIHDIAFAAYNSRHDERLERILKGGPYGRNCNGV